LGVKISIEGLAGEEVLEIRIYCDRSRESCHKPLPARR